jgi:hypothetical protein
MPPKTTIRLKGQACLDFWTALCREEKSEVPTAELEVALMKRFAGAGIEEWAMKLITSYAMTEKPGKPTVSVEEFDHFVRRFLPFEECVPVAVNALLNKATKWFYPWFHGFNKPDFPGAAEKQFYVRLSTNTQPSQGDAAEIIPAHCLVLHYKKVKAGKVNVAVRLINRQKDQNRYQFRPSADERFYDSFQELIKVRMVDQGYAALPSTITPLGGAAPPAGHSDMGMYHSQLSIDDLKGKDPKDAAAPTPKCSNDECATPAALWCEEDGLYYCEPCGKKDHSKGNRAQHKLIKASERAKA